MKGLTTSLSIFILLTTISSFCLCFTHNSRADLEVYLTVPTLYKTPDKFRSKNFQEAVTSFSWTLFQGSKLPNPAGNLVLCPISLQFLLSILEIAAEGETKNQLREIIGYSTDVYGIKNVLTPSASLDLQPPSATSLQFSSLSSPPSQSVELSSASGIFLDSSSRLNRTFANVVQNIGADIVSLNFENSDNAKSVINDWVAKRTQGYITNILGPTYHIENTEIILTSAIYFHGTWKFKFNNIEPMLFYSSPDKGNHVEFMETKQNFIFKKIDLGNNYIGSLVEIPYKGDDYSMLIIMPDNNISLDAFIRKFDVTKFDNTIKLLSSYRPLLMKLRMPKFQISSQFSVVNSLLKMGLVNLFTINSRLPYIGLKGEQKISDIFQQAVLNVDENGTVAAAASASVLVALSANRDDFVITINKPFLSVILDKKNHVPLFISKIYSPKYCNTPTAC